MTAAQDQFRRLLGIGEASRFRLNVSIMDKMQTPDCDARHIPYGAHCYNNAGEYEHTSSEPESGPLKRRTSSCADLAARFIRTASLFRKVVSADGKSPGAGAATEVAELTAAALPLQIGTVAEGLEQRRITVDVRKRLVPHAAG